MIEVWKDVPGYEGLYQVSNFGRVKSLNYYGSKGSEHIISTTKTRDGYERVRLFSNRKTKYARINRLVWEAFVGPIPEGIQINHIDENKSNNNLLNLNLMSPMENTNWGTGIQRRAETQTNKNKSKAVRKYTLDWVFIKEYPSTMEVQRIEGYANTHISDACNGKSKTAYGYKWKYVDV